MDSVDRSSLLERAKAYVSRSPRPTVGAAAMMIVPLAAAAPVQAGYLTAWHGSVARTYLFTDGTVQKGLQVAPSPGGSTVTGNALFTLNKSTLADVHGTFTGLGAGNVSAGDAVEFTWDFDVVQTGSAPIDSLEWQVVGYYDSTTSPLHEWSLASGEGFTGSSGAAVVTFPQDVTNMNWHGLRLDIDATVAGTTPGQYAFRVDVGKLQFAYLPEPASLAAAGLTAALVLGRRRTQARG
jgi:hypothetical protein